ncbi:MAG: Rieske (2Fe-2S) protein [Panacibacter sp.]
MNRKKFIKSCGLACLGGALPMLLPGCSASSKMVGGKITGDDLVVDISDFETKKGAYKNYLIVENEILSYPVCVYRFSENEYAAMFMRCTHQGTELQVFGDKLQCPAHGSEFNNRGIMQNGPASINLRTFPVTIENHQLKISLKPA